MAWAPPAAGRRFRCTRIQPLMAPRHAEKMPRETKKKPKKKKKKKIFDNARKRRRFILLASSRAPRPCGPDSRGRGARRAARGRADSRPRRDCGPRREAWRGDIQTTKKHPCGKSTQFPPAQKKSAVRKLEPHILHLTHPEPQTESRGCRHCRLRKGKVEALFVRLLECIEQRPPGLSLEFGIGQRSNLAHVQNLVRACREKG